MNIMSINPPHHVNGVGRSPHSHLRRCPYFQDPSGIVPETVKGELELRDVSFTYPARLDAPVFRCETVWSTVRIPYRNFCCALCRCQHVTESMCLYSHICVYFLQELQPRHPGREDSCPCGQQRERKEHSGAGAGHRGVRRLFQVCVVHPLVFFTQHVS